MNLIKKKFNHDSFQLFLVCLIPFGLVFSRFVADFCLVLVCLIFIIKNSKKKIFIFIKDPFVKIFLIFWLIVSLRSLFSEDVLLSFKSSFFYIRFMLFALAVKFLFNIDKRYLYYFFYSISFCLVVLVFDGLIQFIFKKNILGYPAFLMHGGDSYRLSGFFKDEFIIGSFISRILPFYLGIYMYGRHVKAINNKDNYIFILLLLSSLLVLLSGERVAVFYISLTVILGIIFINFYNYKIYLKIFVIAILFISVLTLHDGTRKRIIDHTFGQIGIINDKSEATSNNELYVFSIHHHSHIIAANAIFKENILFGAGLKMFRVACDKRHKKNFFSCTTHPHNTIMQFLSETGLVGTLFYVISLIYVLKYLFLNIRYSLKNVQNNLNKSRMFNLLALFIALMPILPSGNFFNNWISIVSFFPVGFYLLSISKYNEH